MRRAKEFVKESCEEHVLFLRRENSMIYLYLLIFEFTRVYESREDDEWCRVNYLKVKGLQKRVYDCVHEST